MTSFIKLFVEISKSWYRYQQSETLLFILVRLFEVDYLIVFHLLHTYIHLIFHTNCRYLNLAKLLDILLPIWSAHEMNKSANP